MYKILFLEDEDTIRDVLTEYMTIAGYSVMQATTGNEALKLLSENSFDIAVLDIMVPGPSGLEVLESMKRSSKHKNTGAIMLTALDETQTQLNAFNAFADDYVIKPAAPIILLKRIEAVLRRTKSSVLEKKQGLALDRNGYRVLYNGEQVNLTISEFLLLQALWDNKDRVFTREQLILSIFNDDYAANDRIIDAHIKNIRKKLPIDCIRTIVGVGYQFDNRALE